MGEFAAKYYQDWYREKRESYEYMLSSEEKMHLSSGCSPWFDETSRRWYYQLGCGFRYHRDARDCLAEAEDELAYCYAQTPVLHLRQSFVERTTYNYEQDIFCASYELREYQDGQMCSILFYVEDVSLKTLDKIDLAVKEWHATGKMVWEGLILEPGGWIRLHQLDFSYAFDDEEEADIFDSASFEDSEVVQTVAFDDDDEADYPPF